MGHHPRRALKLKAQAHKLGVPVLRDVPLARTLVQLDIGSEIPEELYEAVAVILKTAMDLTAQSEQKKAGRANGRKR